MLKNYLKIAFRNLTKNKTFSFINIIGLGIGTICCLYIVMYVTDQYSYDKQHIAASDIYRVNTAYSTQGNTSLVATTSPPIAPAMKNDFGEVMQYTRVVKTSALGVKQHLLSYRGKNIYEKEAAYADSTLFDVFSFHFVYGDPLTALAAPYSVVLFQPTARRLFGDNDPVGNLIEINNDYGKHTFKVTGVIDESLGKSHLQTNLFMSMNSGGMGSYTYQNNAWAAYNYTSSYVKLKPNSNAASLEKKLPAFVQKYGAGQLKELGMEKQLSLQPVMAIHTSGDYKNEFTKTVNRSFLNMLLLIAALIQVIAGINFMNLATARASKRAKEVGVRKVVGAGISDLVRQFLGESILLSMLGVLVALPLLVLLLPYLNRITQADIPLSYLLSYRLWGMLLAIALVTGLLAGSYPAFYLSAFKPVKVLKGNFSNHISANGIRRLLVVFQFVLSIAFVAGIIVIYSQLNYIKNKDLGFEKNQRLILHFYTDDTKAKVPALLSDLRQLPEVISASQAENYPSQSVARDWSYYLEGADVNSARDVQFMNTDDGFIKTVGIKLMSGRDFRPNDHHKVLINETFAKELGIDPATAPGRRVSPVQEAGEAPSFMEIAGVMKDFNYNSLHNDVHPLMLKYDPENASNNVIISVSSLHYTALLEKIGRIWQKDFPAIPFEYSFLDEEVQKQYETETTLSNIINSFTGIAIFISCLGLFGLSAFSVEQRNKEIGIRKVLGASVAGLVSLLSKDFLKLVGISFIIATPIAWWGMHQWLETFAYRIPLSWWMFGLAGMLAMLIALCTVSVQAVKGAIANPIRSLKTE
ncbi:ABC transporter permease [Chitinophaga arvensicola]|uniref:Putative ABC transport system permease protein n=1 Tax=Chitinophaga arvensicola TaxID=29529 RepID=A0A1I0S8T5_9BACT|nr:ABC transporter permease [Chitinophaga arvensicola]SEW52385.1 putative ABC transport system permease protein [Chitinophaga arvensicola]